MSLKINPVFQSSCMHQEPWDNGENRHQATTKKKEKKKKKRRLCCYLLLDSICKELELLQCSIDIINIINCCYQRKDLGVCSPASPKLRLKIKTSGPEIVLHQPIPYEMELVTDKTKVSPPPKIQKVQHWVFVAYYSGCTTQTGWPHLAPRYKIYLTFYFTNYNVMFFYSLFSYYYWK